MGQEIMRDIRANSRVLILKFYLIPPNAKGCIEKDKNNQNREDASKKVRPKSF